MLIAINQIPLKYDTIVNHLLKKIAWFPRTFWSYCICDCASCCRKLSDLPTKRVRVCVCARNVLRCLPHAWNILLLATKREIEKRIRSFTCICKDILYSVYKRSNNLKRNLHTQKHTTFATLYSHPFPFATLFRALSISLYVSHSHSLTKNGWDIAIVICNSTANKL